MYQHSPSAVKFREDIHGLRAWAVVAVLLFHFTLIGLPGGFAGVDVFFVISGYLMTAIIVGGYEKGNFSIWKFYMARAKRILPALLAVIAVLLILGWFWLPTPDYQALGAQSVYGMSFLSNIYYWRSAGYFDSAAEEKWLLHTWSLAVEAQFYLLYPIFIALIWKFWKNLKAVTIGVLVLFAASFVLNLIMTDLKPTAAFYLLPTRGWELAAGALVFLLAKQYKLPQKSLPSLFWAGWLMVIGSFFLIDESFVWPGYWAVIPVLGTSLIILANKEGCFLTNNSIAQWLGDRSYSLYLWHWPLVVALYFESLQSDWAWVICFFTISVVLAHFSYQLIETPTRKYLSSANLRKEIFAISSVGVVIAFTAVSVKLFTFEGRAINQTPEAEYVFNFSKLNPKFRVSLRHDYLSKCNFFDADSYTAKKESISVDCLTSEQGGVFIWGDSYAQALSFGLRKYIADNFPSVQFSQVASSGCRPHLSEDIKTTGEFKKSCDRSNTFAIKAIKRIKPAVVIMAQRDEHTDNNLPQIAQELVKLGVERVLIVGPVPQWNIDLPRIIARHYWSAPVGEIEDTNFKHHLISIDRDLTKSFSELEDKRIKYLSVLERLCSADGRCIAILDEKRTPLVFDSGHLTREGSVFVVDNVLSSLLYESFGPQ